MFKLIAAVLMIVASASAKPGILTAAPVAYSAPLVSAPYVAATSSQVFARNYNGIAAAPLVSSAPLAYTAAAAYPYTAPFAAPYTAAAYSAYPYASPYTAAAAYSTYPYAAPYAAQYASAYAAPFAAPLKYTAAPVLL